jgi:putative endonuclease
MKNWKVYILECSDGSLYTGITTDLLKRVTAHQLGKGAKYTKGRAPVEVKIFLSGLDKSAALQIESFIKKCPRKLKIRALALMCKLTETT